MKFLNRCLHLSHSLISERDSKVRISNFALSSAGSALNGVTCWCNGIVKWEKPRQPSYFFKISIPESWI